MFQKMNSILKNLPSFLGKLIMFFNKINSTDSLFQMVKMQRTYMKKAIIFSPCICFVSSRDLSPWHRASPRQCEEYNKTRLLRRHPPTFYLC